MRPRLQTVRGHYQFPDQQIQCPSRHNIGQGIPGHICAVDRDAQRLGVELHRTSAYHPQANGLVERFHRTMKTTLRSRLTSDNWLDELPWIMLGVQTAPEEDLNMSTAELVYDAPLTVPDGFLGTPTEPWSPDNLRSKLTDSAERFAPVPTSRHCQPSTRVPKDLSTSRYAFICHDGYRGPLKRPYHVPYKVISAGN